jgi:sec-independent protein translocase protein TatA
MGRIGPFGITEILIILVLVLLLFGPKRLPEMAKGIGQAVREFRKSVRDIGQDIESDTRTGQEAAAAPVQAATAPEPESTQKQS